jgi:hypothetical protein
MVAGAASAFTHRVEVDNITRMIATPILFQFKSIFYIA